jgi:hypothetical protein
VWKPHGKLFGRTRNKWENNIKMDVRETYEPNKDEETGGWKNYMINSSLICALHQILLKRSTGG